MKLPLKETVKSSKGQVLILYLLVLVIGMAVVLSVASRVVTDIKITNTTDESNRAYFAAEAGIEEALSKLQRDPDFTGDIDLDFEDLNKTEAETEVDSGCDSPPCRAFVYPTRLKKDEVAQITLIEDFNDVTSASPVSNRITFYWGSPSVGGTRPAAEISIIYHKRESGQDLFYIRRWALDKFGRGGFCNAGVGDADYTITDSFTTNSSGSGHTETLKYRKEIVIDGVNCGVPNTPPNLKPILARIKLLHNAEPQPVAVEVKGGGDLPAQGSFITSTGKTVSGVTRKVTAFRLHPAAPPFLDYVLFSGRGAIRK